MKVDKLEPKTRAEWLKMRQTAVTASAVGALLGVHPYLSYFELYMEKTGRLAEFDLDQENGAMLRGALLESVGVEMLRRERPSWFIEPNIIGAGGLLYVDKDTSIGATPDALIRDEDNALGVAQIKSVEPSIFRKEWLQGEIAEPPLWVAAQVITEAMIVGATRAFVVPVRVGHRIEVDIIEVPIHQEVWKRIVNEAAEFWQRVADMRPPQPDYRRDGALLARLQGADDGSAISLAHDNEFCEAIAMREALKARIKEAEDDLKYYETLMRDRIGPHATATTATHIVTHKTQHRKAYQVAANSFRVMRVKEIGGKA
jgi:predicted phage-related endonuclease